MKTLPRRSSMRIAAGLLLLWGCDHSSAVRRDGGTDARDAAGERGGDVGDAVSRDDVVPMATPDADASAAKADVAPDLAAGDGPRDLATDLAPDRQIDAAADDPEPVVEVGDATPGYDSPPPREDAPMTGPEAPDAPVVERDVPAADTSAPRLDATGKDADPNLFRVTVVPNRALDLVFVIDNSPSMVEKQAKLEAQFPKLIQALVDPMTGTLPDLRLAILDQDLGTGGVYTSGACGPKRVLDGGLDNLGDLGRFQMIDADACGVTVAGSAWLEYRQGHPLNYTGDIGTVFSCLARNLGTLGCGIEHTLQAVEFAFVASGLGNEEQRALLRPEAYLGLVFVTDEDDCSAMTNIGMFGDKPELRGESASLRCSTRAHACGGINLTQAPPGFPTAASFSAPLASCAARTDACPNPTDGTGSTDTSAPTTCSALKSIKHMADEVKALKARPAEQIYVAGIFGWPLGDVDPSTSIYKVAPIPNPNTADTVHPLVYDVWPICYDPNHPPVNPDPETGFDAAAALWGGTPGLRLAAFIDEFGEHGGKHSICEPDYSGVMATIGAALARPAGTLCAPARPDGYAGCTARYLVPDGTGRLVPGAIAMPLCTAAAINAPCFRLATDAAKCSGVERVVQVIEGGGAVDGGALPPGTMLELDCRR